MSRITNIFKSKYKTEREMLREIRSKKHTNKLEKIILHYFTMSYAISNILVAHSKCEIDDCDAIEKIREIKTKWQL